MALRVCLLGQFDVRYDGASIHIPSRPAQSLLSFLILNAGITHRRERLAGLFWPDSTDANARTYLRQALWRIRKSLDAVPISWRDYLEIDDIDIVFRKDSAYWLDADAILMQKAASDWTVEDLIDSVSVYQGELLPGFYEEWTVPERERLQAAFDRRMRLLLDRLVDQQRWDEVLEWSERWITLSCVPEQAYVALMAARAGMGNLSGVTVVFKRLVEALERELGVEPSEDLRDLYAQLARGELPEAWFLPVEPPEQPIADLPPAPGKSPFKGLEFYDVADADLFFGRETLLERLVRRLREYPFLLAVVGASGSGKSSVVRAGLVPALLREQALANGILVPVDGTGWLAHIITPTAHPLETLTLSLTDDLESTIAVTTLIDDMARDVRSLHLAIRRLVERRQAARLLLVVDQFEELFALCRDEGERSAFIDNLLQAVDPGMSGPTTVVIALRADFYAHCAEYPRLREALADHQVYIGPMSSQELRRAIEGPAARGEWTFEPGLVDLLLRDVRSEPGALPLLSHALLETWHRRSGRTLTLKGYAESGGVRGGIARTADSVFNHQLSVEQQAIARNIFLRLTELGEGTPDTRRRVTLSELLPNPDEVPKVEGVLDVLAKARLVTLGEGTVEVAHEALIREWPTLRRWLMEDREGLRLHRHLTEAARGWEELDRDPGALYRGARLAQATEWGHANPERLNVLEQAFIEASQVLAEREVAEREAQQQRELEAARKLAETRAQANRRLRWLALGLSMVLLVAMVSAFFAVQQRARAERETHIATARGLAAAAINNLDVDPELSILLALEAVAETDSADLPVEPEAENALHHALTASRVELVLRGHTRRVSNLAFSPDGTRLATASQDGTVQVWNTSTGENLHVFSVEGGFSDVAFSPDGTRLITAGDDGRLIVWDRTTGEQLLAVHAARFRVLSCAFSPDGTRILSGGVDPTARLWDAFTGEELLELTEHTGGVIGVAFSPDGTRLATNSYDGMARVWDASSGEELLTLTVYPAKLFRVAFSPDGKKLVAGSHTDSTARVWDATTGDEILTLQGHRGLVLGVAFSPDGKRIATGGGDRKAKIWDAETGQELLSLAGHTGPVYGVAFSPDGTHLATSSEDGTVRIWNISLSEELFAIPTPEGVFRFAFSPDGSSLAAGTGEDGAVWIWDASTGERLQTFPAGAHTAWVGSVAFSPDGTRLATASDDTTVRIWDIASGQTDLVLENHTDWVNDVAFSPDGTRLATGSDDWLAIVWDAQTGEELVAITDHAYPVEAVAFSAGGAQLVAAGGVGNTALVWNLASLERVLTVRGHAALINDVAVSPDGMLLATASEDGTAQIWDIEKGQTSHTLLGHTAQVVGVAFSPDGARLATASMDGTAKVWDASAGDELITLPVADDTWLSSVAFSPDGRLLGVGSGHGIHVYLTQVEDLVALAESHLTRGFAIEECKRYLRRETCAATTPIPPQTAEGLQRAEAGRGKACEVTTWLGVYDRFFSQMVYKGIQDAVETYGWDCGVFVPQMEALDLTTKIDEAIEADCDLIVTMGLKSRDAAATAALAHPDRHLVVIDAALDPPVDNVWGEIYATDEAAFLAGYAAASVSKSGKVGTFGGVAHPAVLDFMIGFEQGVRYYNERLDANVEVIGWNTETGEGLFIGSFCCGEEGYAMAEQVLKEGADVIMPVAGPLVGEGAAARIKEVGNAYIIGVDNDWALIFPEFADIILTSVEKRVDASVLSVVETMVDDSFEGGTHVGTLANGGVGLAPFHGLDSLVSPQVKAELEQIETDIIAGKIQTKP
jgi:WD40 repeat protein/basic membrane lipoprotein Med (substrate-binding protein (PBP1-ABC) superfamily)/DNA-binding SARP family transcriptional activator